VRTGRVAIAREAAKIPTRREAQAAKA
jgi:hypothetical protein